MNKNDLKQYCALNLEGEAMLKEAFSFLNLSPRAHDKILKVARTIADLDGRKDINCDDLAEAVQYRVQI